MDTDTEKLVGAGRTDAGVHAKAMTANALLDTTLPVREIRDYMNRYLPDDIVILEVSEASQRFHSRYNATGKTYCYTCYVGQTKPVFDRRYVTKLEGMPADCCYESGCRLSDRHARFCQLLRQSQNE